MANSRLLTQDSKDYLCCFYQILDEMIQGITGASLNQSISHNFIVQMIPHHRAAVRMCENILRFTQNRAVRRIANNIITEQTQGIGDMEAILSTCSQLTSTQQDLRLYQRRMDLIYREMFSRMGSAPQNNNLSAVFMQEMIPHHLGAIRMAENTLQYPVCVQLDSILRSIITEQRRGVAQMRSLLRQMGINPSGSTSLLSGFGSSCSCS